MASCGCDSESQHHPSTSPTNLTTASRYFAREGICERLWRMRLIAMLMWLMHNVSTFVGIQQRDVVPRIYGNGRNLRRKRKRDDRCIPES
jgi:hypothetical protein